MSCRPHTSPGLESFPEHAVCQEIKQRLMNVKCVIWIACSGDSTWNLFLSLSGVWHYIGSPWASTFTIFLVRILRALAPDDSLGCRMRALERSVEGRLLENIGDKKWCGPRLFIMQNQSIKYTYDMKIIKYMFFVAPLSVNCQTNQFLYITHFHPQKARGYSLTKITSWPNGNAMRQQLNTQCTNPCHDCQMMTNALWIRTLSEAKGPWTTSGVRGTPLYFYTLVIYTNPHVKPQPAVQWYTSQHPTKVSETSSKSSR